MRNILQTDRTDGHTQNSLAFSQGWVVWLAMALILGISLGHRILYFDSSNVIAERQYRSALLARAYYLSNAEAVPEWRREVAQTSAQRMGLLEPPVMEYLTARIWWLIGTDQMWVPRLLSSMFWLLGGLCLFLLARSLTDIESALYGVVYYLFLPLGVSISTAFVPDPLMLALFVGSILGMVRYSENPSWRRLLITGVVSSLCILIKPLCLFGLIGSFAALQIQANGLRRVFGRHSLAFVALAGFPTLGYYIYGIYVAEFLAGQAEGSFIPELLFRPGYWASWILTAINANGTIPVILAVLGFAFVRNQTFRALIGGLLAGYFVFCMVFANHVRFAGYYHLQLAVPIALALGPCVSSLRRQVSERAGSRLIAWALLMVISLLALALNLRETNRLIASASPIVDPKVARVVGEVINHSTRVIYLSQYYGTPLEYYGELSGWQWPNPATDADRARFGQKARSRSIEERLASLQTAVAKAKGDFVPDYFAITDFRQFAYHPDLAEYLIQNCEQIADDPAYLIYANCTD